MVKELTTELFQKHENDDATIRCEVLYNNRYDYFYFNLFENEELILGDTRIVNEFENEYLKFSSLKADYATFDEVETFILEFLK